MTITKNNFLSWLENGESWTQDELIDLCLVGFESHRESGDSYEQILLALRESDQKTLHEKLLAQRLAVILTTYPALDFPVRGEETTPIALQTNVLMVAAGLIPTDLLGEPLNFVTSELGENIKNLAPSVRGALMIAVMCQQKQNETQPVRNDESLIRALTLLQNTPT